MRKLKLVAALIAALFLANSAGIASADTKPIEQYWDAGPSVKNVGGYTGVLVEDSFLLTNQQSNLVGY